MSLPHVTSTEAARLLAQAGYVYLDVRSVEEFELGHVRDAFNLPWVTATTAAISRASGETSPNPRFLAVARGVFALEQGLVVGCQSGQRSALAGALLRAHGFAHVLEHRAGFGGLRDAFGQLLEQGWERAGLPVGYEAAPGRSYRELCEAAPELD